MPTDSELITDKLFIYENEIIHEFSYQEHFEEFVNLRWMIKPKKLKKKYNKFSDNLMRMHNDKIFVIKAVNVLKKIIKWHCLGVLSKLEKINNVKEFLSEYCLRVSFM